VYKLMGIQSLNSWLLRTMEELVRSCDSKVDIRHPQLIADVMTRPGTITPMTRNGLLNSTNSPCRLLFENVLENIKMFAAYSARDNLKGVPECILMGNLAPVGTGFSKAVFRPTVSAGSEQGDPKTIVHPYARRIPCQAPSFRFFQQWVPVNRSGQYYKSEYATVIHSKLGAKRKRTEAESGARSTQTEEQQPQQQQKKQKRVRYDEFGTPAALTSSSSFISERSTTTTTKWTPWKCWTLPILIQITETQKMCVQALL